MVQYLQLRYLKWPSIEMFSCHQRVDQYALVDLDHVFRLYPK